MRSIVVLGLAAALAGPVAPGSATVCHLVVDARGDAGYELLATPLPATAYDIVSADIASDGNVVAAVIRIHDLKSNQAGDVDPLAAAGARYLVRWTMTGAPSGAGFVAERTSLNEWSFYYGRSMSTSAFEWIGWAAGRVDAFTNEITMTAPASWFDAIRNTGRYAYGAELGELRAYTSYPRTGGRADAAASPGTYTIGTPSCLRV